MLKQTIYVFKIIFICLMLISCTQKQEQDITIKNAWIREAPPNATAMAGYLSIHNSTDQDRVLTFVKSMQFNTVEIHRTVITDGVARMRRQDELMIPAGESLELKPGDYHLMLIGPKTTFKADDELIVTLCIKHEEVINEIDVKMQVKKP